MAFNSLPAALTPDLKALHYLTAPNHGAARPPEQVARRCRMAARCSRTARTIYRCCQHNVAHGWPYYAEKLWLATADRGLCASLYAASEVTAKVGDGTEVTIAEATDYPFDETIGLQLATPQAVKFPALSARARAGAGSPW